MWRLMHFVAIGALVSTAGYAYSIKYETMWYAEQVVIAKNGIAKEHDTISQLRAEWANLSRPDRIQELADKHLDLKPLSLSQIGRIRDLPEIAPKVDAIGNTIDMLATGSVPASPATPSASKPLNHPKPTTTPASHKP